MLLTKDTFPRHGLTEIVRDSTHMVWLERQALVGPGWEVRAVLVLSDRASDEHVAVNCRVGSPDDPGELGLIGLARFTDSEVVNVRRAWRIDYRGERFVEVASGSVFCLDEGFYERQHDAPSHR